MSAASSSSVGSGLTCGACRLFFASAALQRQHHKSPLHQFNLKRKITNLPPVSAAEFEEHSGTKQNQAKLKERSEGFVTAVEDEIAVTKDVERTVDVEEEDVESVEDGEGIRLGGCLFCPSTCADSDAALEHMSSAHGFFLPHADCCVDVDGLLEYLGLKVGVGWMCLWCDERGKEFLSLDAVRKHMRDVGHCKLRRDGDVLVEFAQFFDYDLLPNEYAQTLPLKLALSQPASASIVASEPDTDCDADAAAEMAEGVLDLESTTGTTSGSDWQLMLPSGATIGHRALSRYYHQHLKPEKSSAKAAKTTRRPSSMVLAHYNSLGWLATPREMAVKSVKDIDFMHRVLGKRMQKQGVKNSGLFVSRGLQDPVKMMWLKKKRIL